MFDGVTAVANGAPISQGLTPLWYFFLTTILLEISNGVANFHYEYLSPTVLSRLYGHLHAKVEHISPIDFEKPDFLDLMNKARQGVESGYLATLFVLSIFTFYIPYFIFMGIYLRYMSPFLIFALILIFIPVILGQVIRFKLFAQVEEDVAPARRAMEYYEKAICDRGYFKETRLLGAYTYFFKHFQNSIKLVNKKTLGAEVKYIRIDLVLRLLTIGGYIGIVALLVHELLNGQISAGAFAAIFASIGMMYSNAEAVFGSALRYISRYAAAIRNYRKFINLPERESKDLSNDRYNHKKGIIFQNVHFRYPEAGQEALRGITLDIAPGETIAIVGENGAGKSTLIKMILGIYEPTKGKVLVGGIDTKKGRSTYIYRACSAVYQKFLHYKATLKENVVISDYENSNDIIAKVERACENADLILDAESFPNDKETMLSREFGGVDLSGGQWQRVAIARGLYRNHDIIILDEPTAAIDPIEETHIYNKFAQLSKDKTAIIITHRLGAARIAKRIIVLRNGLIDDIGTHEQLVERDGLYATLYKEQAQWYKSEK